jgi:hypothetical protein
MTSIIAAKRNLSNVQRGATIGSQAVLSERKWLIFLKLAVTIMDTTRRSDEHETHTHTRARTHTAVSTLLPSRKTTSSTCLFSYSLPAISGHPAATEISSFCRSVYTTVRTMAPSSPRLLLLQTTNSAVTLQLEDMT